MSKLFVIIILIVVLIYILQYSDSRSKNLDSLLRHRWTKMFKNSPKTIGISAYIISPYGNFFGSSLEQGNQINWYFRGGSVFFLVEVPINHREKDLENLLIINYIIYVIF